MNHLVKWFCGTALWFVFLGVSVGWAADSFDYVAFGPGLYMADYPAYYSSQQVTNKNGDTLIPNLDLHSSVNAVKIAYYNKDRWFGKTFQTTLVVPFGRVDMLDGHSVGLGDITMVVGYWLIESQEKGIGSGLGCYLDAPTGQYDVSRTANVGSNHWRIRPTWVFSRFAFPYDLEASATYHVYTENKDTRIRNGDEMMFDSFVGRFLTPRYMGGIHFNYLLGTNREVSGVEMQGTATRQLQAGPSITFTPSRNMNVMLKWLADFGSRNTTRGSLVFARVGWKVK